MGKLRWYKRDFNAALVGMRTLTSDQYKAYNVALDLMYAADNQLRDDDRMMALHLGWNVRHWRRVKGELVQLGKLRIERGLILNRRVDKEVDKFLAPKKLGKFR